MASPRRPLSPDEARILGVLRDHYGPSNDVDAVVFTDRDEAVIFATDRNGVAGICINLTVVPMMQEMEHVADADVFEKYLRPPGTTAVPGSASGDLVVSALAGAGQANVQLPGQRPERSGTRQRAELMGLHTEARDPIAVYRERFAHLRRDFRLFENQVVISGKIAGNDFEATLPLQGLVAEFGVIRFRGRRFWYGITLFGFMAVFAGALATAPSGSLPQFIMFAAVLLAVAGLYWGLSYFRKVAMYRFVNEGGIFVLDFIAAGPDRDHARQFADAVAEAIREHKAQPR